MMLDGQLYACVNLTVDEPQFMADALRASYDAGQQFIFDDDLLTWLGGGKSMTGDQLDKRHKGSALEARPKGTPQMLTKSCSEQFARPVIASCAISIAASVNEKLPPIGLKVSVAYFLIPSDAVMSACLAAGGDWKEVARDSLEYLHKKSQESARLFQKSLGRATGSE